MQPELNRLDLRVILIVFLIVVVGLMLPHIRLMQNVTTPLTLMPKWVEDGRHYQTCSQAMAGTPSGNKPVIDVLQAARVGAEIIAHRTSLHDIEGKEIVVFGAKLVEAPFPNGITRLAWVYGEGRVTDNNSMSAIAEVVFIDAITGDPLLLIQDLYASDPVFTCGQLFMRY